MKNLMAPASFALLVFCCSCSIKISGVKTAENVNMHAYKTYNFYSVTAAGDTIPSSFNTRLAILKTAITGALQAKGFTQSTNLPDMLINIGIHVTKETFNNKTQLGLDGPYYMGQRNYTWESSTGQTGTYRTGAVTIHLVDAKQVRLIWQGTAETHIPGRDTKMQTEANSGMQKLFSLLPLQPRN